MQDVKVSKPPAKKKNSAIQRMKRNLKGVLENYWVSFLITYHLLHDYLNRFHWHSYQQYNVQPRSYTHNLIQRLFSCASHIEILVKYRILKIEVFRTKLDQIVKFGETNKHLYIVFLAQTVKLSNTAHCKMRTRLGEHLHLTFYMTNNV